jgi:hypothetical protein
MRISSVCVYVLQERLHRGADIAREQPWFPSLRQLFATGYRNVGGDPQGRQFSGLAEAPFLMCLGNKLPDRSTIIIAHVHRDMGVMGEKGGGLHGMEFAVAFVRAASGPCKTTTPATTSPADVKVKEARDVTFGRKAVPRALK